MAVSPFQMTDSSSTWTPSGGWWPLEDPQPPGDSTDGTARREGMGARRADRFHQLRDPHAASEGQSASGVRPSGRLRRRLRIVSKTRPTPTAVMLFVVPAPSLLITAQFDTCAVALMARKLIVMGMTDFIYFRTARLRVGSGLASVS